MIVLIDNGHGVNTSGKCSPDKKLYEWKWTREVAAMLEKKLNALGIDARRIVTEDTDIGLRERCRRVNAVCSKYGVANVLLVSIHINAAGKDGKWHDASGWSGWVSKKASTKSKRFAQLLYAEAEKRNLKGNRWVPAERYWQANYTIITETWCPAVLTENMFQDNREDAAWLMTEKGKQTIVDLHVVAIEKYIASK